MPVIPLLLCWLTIALLATAGVRDYRRGVARRLDVPQAAGVVVIVPVKGTRGGEAALAAYLAAVLDQRGIDHRVVFAVSDEGDPAAPVLSGWAAHEPRVTLVVAGQATTRSQKVHNQLAALGVLRREDRFVVFADCDAAPSPDWLAQLLRPLLIGRADLSSGYRWIMPADDRLASRLCALMDWSVATAARSRRWNLCWGGSMAISRDALDRLDLPEAWRSALTDDLVLTRAARRVGITVHAPHQVLLPSPVRHDLRSLFGFGRRQYLIVRTYAPLHWALAGVTLVLPAGAGILAILAAAAGNQVAMATIIVVAALQQLRASLRLDIARRVLLPEQAAACAALVRRDRWLLPVAHLLHLSLWIGSAVGREVTWSGTRYRVKRSGGVEVVSRGGSDREAGR